MIKRKVDVEHFLFTFCLHAEWDGVKFYITIADEKNDGTITIMQYPDGRFTVHRRNKRFCDRRELAMGGDELARFVWQGRKHINRLAR
jgi:hypothetical protein